MRHLVVTPEAEGPHPPSPTATGAPRVAALLGAELCVLRASSSPARVPDSVFWARWAGLGVRRAAILQGRGWPSAVSVLAHGWLAARLAAADRPARALFADAEGLALHCLFAREAGLLPRDVPMGLLVLDPLRRRMEAEGRARADTLGLMRLHAEAEAARMADFFVFADAGLEAWHRAAHPDLLDRPRHALPGLARPAPPLPGAPEVALERVPEGAAALDALARVLAALDAEDDGPEIRLPPDPALPDLLARCLPRRLRIAARAPLGDAFARRSPPRGSVVLALAGDSAGPLAWGAPPGQVVTFAPGDAGEGVAARVRARLGRAGDAAPAPDAAAAAPLRAFLAGAASRLPPPPPLPDPPPLVSVCVSHFDRPALLSAALDSLRAQTYPRVEVVLVDDASPSEAARRFLDDLAPDFAARGWRILRNDRELWQAASRNRAARAARGEFVLVMDDDNLAAPEEVETMVRAALASGADAVGALQNLFRDGEDPSRPLRAPWVAFFPLGGPPALGVAWNIYGDVNALVRRDAFLALGGHGEQPEIGCEDYEFGAALALSGRRLLPLPAALYHYRFSEQNMARGMSNERLFWSHLRPLNPALAACPDPAGRRLLRLANGAEHARQQREGESYWAGAERAAAMPAAGLPARPEGGAAFRAKLALLAARAAARDLGRGVAAALDEPARLHLALAEGRR